MTSAREDLERRAREAGVTIIDDGTQVITAGERAAAQAKHRKAGYRTVTAGRAIDFNRGVTMRRHPISGQKICMYKDDPGSYLDMRGRPVPDLSAMEAGFDVSGDRHKAATARRLANAEQAIRDALSREGTVITERGGYRLVAEAFGHARLERIDDEGIGAPVTDRRLREADALRLLDRLVPPETD